MRDLTYAKNTYVLVGCNYCSIQTSPDAITWTKRWEGADCALTGVTFGNNTFVVAGGYGTTLSSHDGITWKKRVIYGDDVFRDISFGHGQFVVVGDYGAVYSSPDGKDWQKRVLDHSSMLTAIIHTRNGFVTVGMWDTGAPYWYASLHHSRDGIIWTDRIFPVAGALLGVAHGQGSYVIVGTGGDVLQSHAYWHLKVTKDGTGHGTVTSVPQGITCGNSCEKTFPSNSSVILTAKPHQGSTFVGWSGCDEVSGLTCSVSMTGDRTVSAQFDFAYHTLSVTEAGSGVGRVMSTPQGIDCGSTCAAHFKPGTTVTLSASADQGSIFAGWSGGCSGKSPCSISMNADKSVTATFWLKHTLISPNGGETIPSWTTYEIQWEAPPEATSFKLSYSLDNGTTWKSMNTAAPLTDLSYIWQVPKTESNKPACHIKVVGYNDTTKVGADRSDKPFTIEVIKLTYPNGGEPPFLSEQDITITWTAHATIRPINQVKLFYTQDNGLTWNPFLSQPAPGSDPGSHTVKLPTVTKTKSNCKVKVVLKDATGKNVGSDVSDGVFTISHSLSQTLKGLGFQPPLICLSMMVLISFGNCCYFLHNISLSCRCCLQSSQAFYFVF